MSKHPSDIAKPPQTSGPADTSPPTDQPATVDRRCGLDRRKLRKHTDSEFDRRRGPGRRRTDYRRDAEEGHMNEEQLEFIKAVDEYKRVNQRSFPTWTEILDLLLYLGYRKVAEVGEFRLTKTRSPSEVAAEAAESEEPAEAADCL